MEQQKWRAKKTTTHFLCPPESLVSLSCLHHMDLCHFRGSVVSVRVKLGKKGCRKSHKTTRSDQISLSEKENDGGWMQNSNSLFRETLSSSLSLAFHEPPWVCFQFPLRSQLFSSASSSWCLNALCGSGYKDATAYWLVDVCTWSLRACLHRKHFSCVSQLSVWWNKEIHGVLCFTDAKGKLTRWQQPLHIHHRINVVGKKQCS